MAYKFSNVYDSPEDLGEVTYEVIDRISVAPGRRAVHLVLSQYTADDVYVRQRIATMTAPLAGVRNFVNQVSTLARAQGEMPAGTNTDEEV